VKAAAIAEFLDDYLHNGEIRDWPGALNGLQVDSRGNVTRIAAAVDASEATIAAAVAAGCDLLLVHHGLFWDGNLPVTGRRYRRLRLLFEHDIAVYSSHLPLDVHAEVGNNAVLARELGIRVDSGFGERDGVAIGVRGVLEIDRNELHERLRSLLGVDVHLIPGGPGRVRSVAVVTGGGGSMVGAAVEAGLDALITGEGSHHTYIDAMEGGLNLFYGGHYATETWGVRALAALLSERFGLEWQFLDEPSGL